MANVTFLHELNDYYLTSHVVVIYISMSKFSAGLCISRFIISNADIIFSVSVLKVYMVFEL